MPDVDTLLAQNIAREVEGVRELSALVARAERLLGALEQRLAVMDDRLIGAGGALADAVRAALTSAPGETSDRLRDLTEHQVAQQRQAVGLLREAAARLEAAERQTAERGQAVSERARAETAAHIEALRSAVAALQADVHTAAKAAGSAVEEAVARASAPVAQAAADLSSTVAVARTTAQADLAALREVAQRAETAIAEAADAARVATNKSAAESRAQHDETARLVRQGLDSLAESVRVTLVEQLRTGRDALAESVAQLAQLTESTRAAVAQDAAVLDNAARAAGVELERIAEHVRVALEDRLAMVQAAAVEEAENGRTALRELGEALAARVDAASATVDEVSARLEATATADRDALREEQSGVRDAVAAMRAELTELTGQIRQGLDEQLGVVRAALESQIAAARAGSEQSAARLAQAQSEGLTDVMESMAGLRQAILTAGRDMATSVAEQGTTARQAAEQVQGLLPSLVEQARVALGAAVDASVERAANRVENAGARVDELASRLEHRLSEAEATGAAQVESLEALRVAVRADAEAALLGISERVESLVAELARRSDDRLAAATAELSVALQAAAQVDLRIEAGVERAILAARDASANEIAVLRDSLETSVAKITAANAAGTQNAWSGAQDPNMLTDDGVVIKVAETVCAECGFEAKTPAGLSAHRRTHGRRPRRG